MTLEEKVKEILITLFGDGVKRGLEFSQNRDTFLEAMSTRAGKDKRIIDISLKKVLVLLKERNDP